MSGSSLILADHKIVGDEQIATHAQFDGYIREFCHEERKNSDENWQKADEDIKAVGRVPKALWLLWEQQGITEDATELMKALERNPEFKRTNKCLI